MNQDKTGNQILSPISLDCHKDKDWSKYLPGILDEDPEKVQITVALGQAASFLDYEPISYRLTLENVKKTLNVDGASIFV